MTFQTKTQKKTTKPDIKSELNVTDLGERRSLALYKDGQVLTLNVDQVSTYDKNPRIQKNAEYDSIYESIKAKGLEDSLSVSQRPGDDHLSFFLIRGGNTRLMILKKLYKETADKKYYEFSARYKQWESDTDAVIGHLRENDARGDYVFIDRALGVRQVKNEIQEETGEKLSDKGLIRILADQGYKLSGPNLRRMNYAVDILYPHCPRLLSENIGPRLIDDIKKIDKKSSELFGELFPENEQNEWRTLFSEILVKQEEKYTISGELFSYQSLYDAVLDILSKNNQATANRLAFLLDERLNGVKNPQKIDPDILKDNEVPKNSLINSDSSTPIATTPDFSDTQTNKNHFEEPSHDNNTSKIPSNSAPKIEDINNSFTVAKAENPDNKKEFIAPTITNNSQYIYDDPSQHLVHSNWMYPEEANHDFSIFQDMPLTCKDRIEAAPLPENADELREILFYKAFFFKHYMHVPCKVEKIQSGTGFALDKIPDEQGMKLVFDNPKNSKTRINKTTKHYIGWWLLIGFSDLLHQSLIGNFDIIKKYQPEGNLKDYLLTPKDSRLDTIDLIFNHQMGFAYLSELSPLFTSYASPKELQLFIEMTLIHNRLMRVTNHDIWGSNDE